MPGGNRKPMNWRSAACTALKFCQRLSVLPRALAISNIAAMRTLASMGMPESARTDTPG